MASPSKGGSCLLCFRPTYTDRQSSEWSGRTQKDKEYGQKSQMPSRYPRVSICLKKINQVVPVSKVCPLRPNSKKERKRRKKKKKKKGRLVHSSRAPRTPKGYPSKKKKKKNEDVSPCLLIRENKKKGQLKKGRWRK
ncbi:hypothetical protein LY78DRAFT_123581 [Colletotrichum sublineola]|nr:hypothetical protein LY78DRAFT_123581 [Colletotrichum sublineola]